MSSLSNHRLAYIPILQTLHAIYMLTHLSDVEKRTQSVALKRLTEIGVHANSRKAWLYYLVISIPIAGTIAALFVDLLLRNSKNTEEVARAEPIVDKKLHPS